MAAVSPPSSSSVAQPDYWWYRAREELLAEVLGPHVASAGRVLDVGSADGPSVGWMSAVPHRVSLDTDLAALSPGGVCASAMQLPFRDATFDVVAAFDVLEHCEPEHEALRELTRVLRPGGRLLVSVPAYAWAWTDFDVLAGHHRRYTRPRLLRAVAAAGLEVERSTYLFAGTLPAFAAERAVRRLRPGRTTDDNALPAVPAGVERVLMGLCRLDRRLLAHVDLPFGSSVVVAARRTDRHPEGGRGTTWSADSCATPARRPRAGRSEATADGVIARLSRSRSRRSRARRASGGAAAR